MIKIATDCSGVGAPEQALKNLGIEHRTIFACEKDVYARTTYLANHVCEKMFDDVTTRNNDGLESADLYIAGFPCQAFSIAGHRKGFEDIRGTIFFNCADYIRQHRPKVFIFENVRGLLSHDKPKGSKQKTGRTFNTIINLLSKSVNGQPHFPFYEDHLDYDVYWAVLNTKHFGLPQNRQRVFIVGIRDGESFRFPSGTTLKMRLADLLEKNVDEKYYLNEKALSRIARRHKNFNPQINPEVTGTISVKNNSGEAQFDSGTSLVTDEIIRIGKYGDGNQSAEIFDTDGISPAIIAGSKGYAQGFIEEKRIVINNEGQWEERENTPAILSNYSNAAGTTNREHAFILGYTRDEKGEVVKNHEKDIAGTITGSTGHGGNTDQFVVEPYEKAVIIQREHGFNEGGVHEICPTITTGKFQDNNHLAMVEPVLQKVDSLDEKDAEAYRVYSDQGISSTIKSGGGGAGAKTGLYKIKGRIRRLTPRECFRLQGYPDTFDISKVSDTQAYRQAGNSISIPVILGVIRNMLHILLY